MEKNIIEILVQQGESTHGVANCYSRALLKSMSYILESPSREPDIQLLNIISEIICNLLEVQDKEYQYLEEKLADEKKTSV